jgi:predicted exporter
MGLLFAFTLSQLIFEKIHFLTLVFGASLIGVCVDYSFHFFAKHLFAEKTWNSRQAMITILPALVTGAFTSALGYLGLASTPFPGFHQIAVFSILGLMGSLGTVICWFPRLMQKKLPGKTPPYVFVVQKYLGFWQNLKGRHGFLLLPVLLVAGWGISFLKANDDIRALQRVPENLVVEQKWLEDLLGGFETARFILLEGKTSQDLLNLQEKFQPYLEKLQPDHLKKFISVSPYIPSINRQKEDRKLLGETLLNPKGWLGNEIRKMGFSEESIEEVNASLQNWQQGREDYLFPEAWLESEVSLSHRHLWLGKTKRGFASILLLDGVKGDENIQELAESWEGVYYHNRIKEISLLLKRFRIQASLWVALSYGLILFFLLWRYGLQKGILVFLGPVLSLVLTLGWLGISQQEINLFHILSFLLVLGIGIDYSIFMVEAKDPLLSTMVAIFLSATTTILSFGLLSLSEIPVLKTIGNTMLLGIAFSCLFSPLPMLSKIKLKSPNDLG